MENLILKSSAFKDGKEIPSKYTCDGENVNPFLEIRNVPSGAQSLVLVIDDPDATGGETWDHWVVFNIDPTTQYIEEDTIPHSSTQGGNSWGSARYGGPCPPEGSGVHRYMFKLYALDIVLDLPRGTEKKEIEEAMRDHVMAETTLTGLYKRE